MMYQIIVKQITEITDGEAEGVELYRQSVEALDLAQLTAMVNRKPRKPRESRAKLAAAKPAPQGKFPDL